jgi:hypothetical protein
MQPKAHGLAGLFFFAVIAASASARADATISVGGGDRTDYARPPITVVTDDAPPTIFEEPRPELPKDPYRSPFRLTVGPAAITSGQGIGPGLLAAMDLGNGTVGVRLAAAWFRGESMSDPAATLGSSLGLYSGEVVLDLHKGGPFHPILALGLGAVNIGKQTGENGWAVAGLGRIGLEYALALEDADVRFGVGLTGALLGPSDQSISDARAFALMNATFSIGF